MQQHKLMFRLLISFFLLSVILLAASPAHAAQFKTDYSVDYFLDEQDDNIATKVAFKVKITNLTSDLFVRKFSIIFPKSFQIGNIKASDDFKTIEPSVTELDGKHTITVEFSNPLVGLNTENNVYIDFLQYNLFKVNGNVWEVILPTVENKEEGGDYLVTVHLPPNSGKQISISKPKPDHVTLNEIEWRNPKDKTIYAVFGKRQNYKLQLRYHLENPRLTRVYTDITFPPDTLYQKVYVDSIQPKPDAVMMDEDGNYLGRYFLNPKETKAIYFNGAVEVFAEARSEMKQPIIDLFKTQKKFLLSPSTHWKLDPSQMPQSVDSIRSIYDYVTQTLDYNFARLDSDLTRLGASQALQYPDQAVCTEYSDAFIAIAREKGRYTREIQGYGFSNDQDLRPLSVDSDILHSWLEYYDNTTQEWVPLDPTWEDTSGIDYFNSFDLNHIVFAIHGKKSDYPYPAGSYKKENTTTKDINITPTKELFEENKHLSFETSPLQIPALNKNTFTLKITVQNTGNTFIWSLPISAQSDKLMISPSSQIIPVLAPYQKKELSFEYKPNNMFSSTEAKIFLVSDGVKLYEHGIKVTSVYFMIITYGAMAFGAIIGVILVLKLVKKMVSYKDHE